MGVQGRTTWGPIRSILVLAPILIIIPLYTLHRQFSLPVPNIHPYDPETNIPHPSEATILSYARYLSEDIGYRTPGTREHAIADAWLYQKLHDIGELCRQVVEKEPGRKLECTIWRQEGSGSHRFDIMATRLYKTYVNLSNLILRISDGTERSKADTVLVNAHLDSTLPSPGATDDALPVAVMLECARVLIETPGWEPKHGIIFLFNNAEESLQDGSHLYSTQHETASTVRAAVNLEAAGTTGPAMLFQATSEPMIEAYSHVPRPYGTVFANEVFSSGILLSDTDFRQFEQYLNVTGLDMAVVGNSYMYHMRGDLVENIQSGVAQHMADNVLALLRYLSSENSPIPTLANGFVRPQIVFFGLLGSFFVYSFTTAKILYGMMFVASLCLVRVARVKRVWSACGAVLSALVGAIIGANVVAAIMKYVLNKPLSWFKGEYYPLALYGPAAIGGMLISQLPFSKPGKSSMERPIFAGLLLFHSFLAAIGQFVNIGSSAAPFIGSLGFFTSLCLDTVLAYKDHSLHSRDDRELPLWAYPIAMLLPLSGGVQLLAATLVVFVPLTGRTGGDAPAEFIIASIVAVIGALCVSFTPAFAHRFGPRILRLAVVLILLGLGVAMAFFYSQNPFDRMHQKRLFVVHKEDLVTGKQDLHIAAADGAPGFDGLVHETATRFGEDGIPPQAVVMNDYNGDWDTLYPFSVFLSPYRIELPVNSAADTDPSPPEHQFTVTAVSDRIDAHVGRRHLTLKIDHPGIIWTVIAFDAHVLEWTLDNTPPDEYVRHHIKEASFYGTDSWNVSVTIKHPPPASRDEGLKVNFIGIVERRMWPAKKDDSDESSAMKLFEEFDKWIEERMDGTVDPLLIGCVSGHTVV
ncbi:hypothetical protein V8B97DRAFT_2025645 [Scleroderma yunnanense]